MSLKTARACRSCATRSRTRLYLDLRAGRLDAAFSDYLEAYGGFLTKPEGEGYDVAGERLFGKTAEEKAVIGEGSASQSGSATRSSRQS